MGLTAAHRLLLPPWDAWVASMAGCNPWPSNSHHLTSNRQCLRGLRQAYRDLQGPSLDAFHSHSPASFKSLFFPQLLRLTLLHCKPETPLSLNPGDPCHQGGEQCHCPTVAWVLPNNGCWRPTFLTSLSWHAMQCYLSHISST